MSQWVAPYQLWQVDRNARGNLSQVGTLGDFLGLGKAAKGIFDFGTTLFNQGEQRAQRHASQRVAERTIEAQREQTKADLEIARLNAAQQAAQQGSVMAQSAIQSAARAKQVKYLMIGGAALGIGLIALSVMKRR